MKLLLYFETIVGIFYIGQSSDGKYHPIFDDDSLGGYNEAWQATEDLAGDHTYSICHPETGERVDTSTLGIPDHPSEWYKITSSI
jgi:hypothetical protein